MSVPAVTEVEQSVLLVPTAADVMRQPMLNCLQDKTMVGWVAPQMVADLSEKGVTLALPKQGKTLFQATYSNTYRRQLVYGFHHLHALLSDQMEFNCQEVENYDGRLKYYLAHEPPDTYCIPRIRSSGAQYQISQHQLGGTPPIELGGFTFFGSPIEPANWGMWLLHGLQSAFSYVAAGQPGRYLCFSPYEWQKNLLQFMGISSEKIVQQIPWTTYACEEVSLHQYSRIDLSTSFLNQAVFRNIISRCCKNDNAHSPEKIFIGRQSVTRNTKGKIRPLRNELELTSRLLERGYVLVEPELLPFEEQVRVFNGARKVVGLGGAGMFNTVFCQPGTQVVSIEATGAFAHNHARLFSSRSLQYGLIFGQQESVESPSPHSPWSIDIERAMTHIEGF